LEQLEQLCPFVGGSHDPQATVAIGEKDARRRSVE
jgi:hypothetical protein